MTSPTSQQRYGSTEEGLLERLRGVVAALSGYSRARLELAGIEGREAFGLYFRMLLLAMAGVLLAVVGYLLLCVGIVALIAAATGIKWGWGVVILSVLHLIGAAVCAWFLRQKSQTPVFTATIEEFRRDEQWLRK